VNGTIFAGIFYLGEKSGLSVETSSEFVMMAEYSSGKKKGHGLISWSRGDIFSGNFEDDMPNGRGQYLWFNGESYEGDFVNAVR
jgi:hypothetical protein